MYSQYPVYIRERLYKSKQRPKIQDDLQIAIFGEAHKHFQIHVS